jgi:nucleoside-diphosphate-sugar epimerase
LQRFPYGDVCNAELVDRLAEEADIVIHFAAETQFTRSMDE